MPFVGKMLGEKNILDSSESRVVFEKEHMPSTPVAQITASGKERWLESAYVGFLNLDTAAKFHNFWGMVSISSLFLFVFLAGHFSGFKI